MRRAGRLLFLAMLAWLAASPAARAADTAAAIELCQNLLPVFAQSPNGITVASEDQGDDAPFGVRIGWTGGAAGDGWMRCWFLPRNRTGEAWQFTQVESSRYGRLSRYDIQQAFKLLRLQKREAVVAVEPVTMTPAAHGLYLLQQALNALTLACVYALVAVAFTLTAAAARTIMFAFGELVTLGAWLFLIVHVGLQLGEGLAVPIVIGIGLAVCAATSGLVARAGDRLVFRRLRGGASSPALIASIGLAISLQEAIRLAVGNRPRQMSVVADARIVLIQGHGFDVSVTSGHLWVAACTVLIAAALGWLLARTDFGRSLRAVVQDAGAAALMGVDVDRVIGRTFFLGGALGGIGGLALIAEYGIADQTMGTAVTIKALTAAIIGGIGSVPGAFAGGFLIAAVETAASAYGDTAWREVWVLAALVACLIFRPEGLFTTRRVRSEREVP